MTAPVYLALLYLQGEGVPKDSAAATQWLEQASWRGNTQGMGMYAALLFGSFVKEKSEKNLVEGYAWSHQAAELNFIQAMLTTRVLIAMYMNEGQIAKGEKLKKELHEKIVENRKKQLETPAFIMAQNLFAKAMQTKSIKDVFEEKKEEALPAPNLSEDRMVNLEGIQLEKFPTELFLNRNLRSLYLSDNNLRELPEQIGQLIQLEYLSIDLSPISSVPATIGELRNLQSLWLGGNQLKEVPASIGQLEKLKYLTLKGNHLKTIPKEIGRLTNLKLLELGGNELTEIPEEITQLQNLEQLELGNNKITRLPSGLSKLQKLTTLNLQRNKLERLSVEIRQLKALISLYLGHNDFKEIPTEIFDLANLRFLSLNALKVDLAVPGFSKLVALEYLFLGDMGSSSLPEQILSLPNLKKLYLSGNAFSPEEQNKIHQRLPNVVITF